MVGVTEEEKEEADEFLKGTAEEEEEKKKSLDSIVIIITITCSPNIHTNAFLTATLNSIFTQPERGRLLKAVASTVNFIDSNQGYQDYTLVRLIYL